MRSVATLAFLGVASLPIAHALAADASEILGCWNNVDTVATRDDGKRNVTVGQCSRFYTSDKIFITCVGPNVGQTSTLEYEYAIVAPGEYSQNMTSSSHTKYTVNYRQPNKFELHEGTLSVTSYPDYRPSTSSRYVVSLEGRFIRPSKPPALPSECIPSSQTKPQN